MKTLLNEAITDAKSIREAAIANAKKALEETLTPKLQEMFDAQLEEDYGQEGSDDDLDESINLDAILAELDSEDDLNEGKDDEEDDEDDDKDDKKPKDSKPKPAAKSPAKPAAKPAAKKDPEGDLDLSAEDGEDDFGGEGEEKVSDLSVEDLKQIIGDIVSQEFGSEDDNMEHDGLQNDQQDSLTSDLGDSADPATQYPGGDDANDEPLDLEELLAELDGDLNDSELQEELDNTKNELNEAMKIVSRLRRTLNEVNLTNSKLLYLNKILKAKNLTESQKTRVLNTFDKAETIKEAKLIYESLSNTLVSNTKQPLRESRMPSSTIIGRRAPRAILEVDDNVARMQKLAGITK